MIPGSTVEEMVMLAVDEQPFADNAVTVYVPELVMLTFAEEPKLLLHKYDAPPVAATLMDVVVHVSSVDPVLFVIPAVGFAFTVAVTAILSDTIPVTSLESNA